MERSLLQFIRDSMGSVLFLMESKLGKSTWVLLSRPGVLTKDFMQGKHVPYVHPFRLFIAANIVFFFIAAMAGHSPLSTRLQTHLESRNFFHQSQAEALVSSHVGMSGEAFEIYEEAFDRRIDVLARSLVFLLIPLFALMSSVLFFWKKEYAVKHLAFSCHIISFVLVFTMVPLIMLDWSGLQGVLRMNETMFSLLSASIIVVYLTFAVQNDTSYHNGSPR